VPVPPPQPTTPHSTTQLSLLFPSFTYTTSKHEDSRPPLQAVCTPFRSPSVFKMLHPSQFQDHQIPPSSSETTVNFVEIDLKSLFHTTENHYFPPPARKLETQCARFFSIAPPHHPFYYQKNNTGCVFQSPDTSCPTPNRNPTWRLSTPTSPTQTLLRTQHFRTIRPSQTAPSIPRPRRRRINVTFPPRGGTLFYFSNPVCFSSAVSPRPFT